GLRGTGVPFLLSGFRITLAARLLARLAQPVQLLPDLVLQGTVDRAVVHARAPHVREPGLVQGHATGRVVVVLVALVVAQLLHQLRWRVAQVHGHLGRTVLVHVGLGRVVGRIGRVRLGGAGQVYRDLGHVHVSFGSTQ